MNTSVLRWLWPFLAACAGAITALSFRPYRSMEGIDIAVSLFVGASFATFVGPWVVLKILGTNSDPRMEGAIYYGLASGSNVLIPLFIRWIRRSAGISDKEDAK